MPTVMKPKVKPRILGLILGRNVAGPESPSSDSPPPHTPAGWGGGGFQPHHSARPCYGPVSCIIVPGSGYAQLNCLSFSYPSSPIVRSNVFPLYCFTFFLYPRVQMCPGVVLQYFFLHPDVIPIALAFSHSSLTPTSTCDRRTGSGQQMYTLNAETNWTEQPF